MRASWIVLAACSRLPPAAPAGKTVALAAGSLAMENELMEFRVSLRGVTFGFVQTAIGRPGWVEGHRAIIVRSRGQGDGLAALFGEITWELTTTLDLDSGMPIEDREEATMAFAGKHEHARDDHTWHDGDTRHDPHSAIGVIRAWSSHPGDRIELEVTVGGGHFEAALWDAGREYLATAHKPAVRYDGVADHDIKFAAWLSDDAARVPLAFHAESPIGVIAIDLVDYQAPQVR